MPKDPEQLAHQQWLGYVQPVGLVVSIPALLAAQAHVNRNIAPEHQRFLACLCRDKHDELIPEIQDFRAFTKTVLGWEPADLVDCQPSVVRCPSSEATDNGLLTTDNLEVTLTAYNETLRPTWAVREWRAKDPDHPWLMLIQAVPRGMDFDEVAAKDERHWQASPHARFERLLRETEVPIGLLASATDLRLVYAPRGETSGYMTFPVKAMAEVAGRPMFAALHMLLEAPRLFSMAEKQRLPAILADSRKYQNVVSTQLAVQVLAALYELVRGFQAADDQRKGQLLADVLREDPNHVYAGLLTVLMRLVFVLYAEDRNLLSSDPVYANFYSVTGLFERLRTDEGRYTDTMDQRYGAWAQLLTLFRMVYEGGRHGNLRIPGRKGYLFDPDRYNFLEGRPWSVVRGQLQRTTDNGPWTIPHISDGVVYRVLQNLLILDGERLSYRTLDVEQIGSVYETMMGFNLQVAEGRSIAVKPTKSHGAPATINLEALLAAKPAERAKWLADQTDQKITGQAADALKKAGRLEDLLAALEKKIAWHATPSVAPKGAMVLQPSDERRRSGSHYTPRSLTEPIVRTTLRPVLERLRVSSPLPPGEGKGEGCPTPEQLLELNVCDSAMGSGAFLVEACRQLGDELVKAWHTHNQMPKLPPDEDEILHARRLIAQRCLYGVDRNPMAVDLAKLSLWLATLAKDHPFTFLDHCLRAGDSLVGLSKKQIAAFHWGDKPLSPARARGAGGEVAGTFSFGDPIAAAIQRATEFRQRILAARDEVPYEHLRQQLDAADDALDKARFVGDLVVAAYFSAEKDKARDERLRELALRLVKYLGPGGKMEDRQPLAEAVRQLRSGDRPVPPFHWEIEFPEVFGSEALGFDAIVGNPPFAGKNTLINSNPAGYIDWLKTIHDESHGNADLVAHFFRRAFGLIRAAGCFGLIATNTIGQGDTRSTGLRWICTHGGTIFAARKRCKWPGQAAVVVSLLHVCKGTPAGPYILDDRPVPVITAYLFHAGGHDNPAALKASEDKSFVGSYVLGMGFTFDNTDTKGVASPIAEMHRLIAKDPRNAERIFPFIGGEEVNDSPTHAYHRYVINFGEMTEDEARQWPDLIQIVEEKVKPERTQQKRETRARFWWRFGEPTPALFRAIARVNRVLVISQVTQHIVFAFLDTGMVYSHRLYVLTLPYYNSFSVLQSQCHDIWARFFGSSLEERFMYAAADCFETFPFPSGIDTHTVLEMVGNAYYEFRAALMVRNNEGLTKTYNRFHDPGETSPDILKFRELHAAMDRAVLDAYGWTDLKPTCEFLLDYEEEDEDENALTPGPSPGAGEGRRKKKPWRYRWPDEFRDEVLARLLELNKQRAEEEAIAGQAAEATAKATGKKPARRKAMNPHDGGDDRRLLR
ncbi:MAG: type IIL restriction-modification enzyme MmeI [Thermoguttaceae bacterium]|jgi:hypothetical protein